MTGRQGATLVEVLVAIFVMGIGMIALLTLFPLGALRMALAIQEDNTTRAAGNANAVAIMRNVRNDPTVRTPVWFSGPTTPAGVALPPYEVFKDAISSPPANIGFNYGRTFAADPNGPSYPVYVDPIGVANSPPGSTVAPSQFWLGTGGGSYSNLAVGKIARTSISFVTTTTAAFKWFSLLDDMNYDNDPVTGGVPPPGGTNPPATGVLQRDIRYSWAYLLQRPRSSDPSIVNCSVVVYNKRPLNLNNTLALSESSYNAVFNVGKNSITIDWTNAPEPNVRVGDWLLDSTYVALPAAGPTQKYATTHAYFYRIVGKSDAYGPTLNLADYEVQQTIRGFPIAAVPPATTFNGQVMILEGVAEVYERGLDRKFD